MAHILIDGREFVSGRRTGIGRFLEGLLLAVSHVHDDWALTVAMDKDGELPESLIGKVEVFILPKFPELVWSKLSQGKDLFLSPYPKLPLRRLTCPSIHTVHDVFYLTHPAYQGNSLRRFAGLWRLRHALKKSGLTWFDSQATADECANLCGDSICTSAIRYPSVEDRFSPSKQLEIPEYFLFVGNGLPHKNISVLLQAVKGTSLQIKCVGVRPEIAQALLTEHGLADEQVVFLQGVDDQLLLQLYRQATCLLQPSTAEGYGYPPLEAMACGIPAIVSDIAVLRETTGGCAVYCAPHDAKAWRDAMLLLQDEQIREEKVSLGLNWARQHQGVAGWAEHLADIESLLNTKCG